MKLHPSPLFLAALLATAFASVSSAAQDYAGHANINVTPLRLDLYAQQSDTQMLVRNQGEREIALQLRVFEWTQRDGEDVYSPASDVLVSPSITRIAPGLAQTFHVLSRGQRLAGTESRYRVVIDELPGNAAVAPGTARTRLRLTIPLFLDSDTASPGALAFAARPETLLIANSGGRAIRLTDIRVTRDGQHIDLGSHAPLQYVHGENWIGLPLPSGVACSGTQITVSAFVGEDQIHEAASQDCP